MVNFVKTFIMRYIAILILAMIQLNVYSQDREDGVIPEFILKSESIKKAKGWSFNEANKKWMENQNVIHKENVSLYMRSFYSQNFQQIRFVIMEVHGQKHYILLHEKLSGGWKYPNIMVDWEEEKQTHYFVIDELEYQRIKNDLLKYENDKIEIKSKIHGFISNKYHVLGGANAYTQENIRVKILKSISEPEYSSYCFNLTAQILKDKKIVRFRLPESCNHSYKDFDKNYFEIDANEFLKILTLIKE
jgi:hypothetical protein